MSLVRERRRRLLDRVDVRLAVVVAGSAAALTSLLLCGLLAYAISEAFEEQGNALGESTAALGAAVATHHPEEAPVPVHRGVAYRVTDPQARMLASAGAWPAADGAALGDLSLWHALTCSERDYLVRRQRFAGGATVDAALPLRHFVRERGELERRAAGVVLLGMALSLGFGVAAARRALRPVRETTAAVRAVAPDRLDARIATRGTDDDVDELAAAINEVLGRLAWAFGRLSRFSADVAHELRTPINRVLNRAEVALLSPPGECDKDEALEAVHATAEQMRGTVEQLLLLGRGEEGRLHVVREPVDLERLLHGLVSLYAPLAEQTGSTIELLTRPAEAVADRGLLERAVANLLENALRHTPRGAKIRVGVSGDGSAPTVTVEDSGPGIPLAERERVFERFVRLDPARQSDGGGLGLSIARMIARLHGGELWVDVSTLGGAAFHLTVVSAVEEETSRRARSNG